MAFSTARWRACAWTFIALAALAWPRLGLADGRLPHQVVPTEQAISLRLDADQRDYTGSTEIALNVAETTSTFQFHSEGLTLTKLTLTQDKATIPTSFKAGELGILTVNTGKPLHTGPAHLSIEYSNTFDTTAVSLYRMDADGHGYCFSQMESDDAREAFPCWDEPIFKIPYQLTISVPVAHIAVSNMPVEKETTADGWKTDVFKKSPPMPSYLIAIATGPFDVVPIPGMSVPGNVICPKGQGNLAGEAVKTVPPILAALEKYFGMPYPFEKLDVIAVPEFWPGAMENPGAVTYAEGILLLDPSTISVGQKRTLAAVTAHEFAHMWFGDLVTMQWWDDLWLNESFASWMATKVTGEVFPQYGMDISEVRSSSGAMQTDARPSTHAIRQPVAAGDNLLQSADDLAYNKGEAVLGMFEHWLGEEAFRRGIVDYLKTNSWKNATADDLWRALTNASGKDFAATMGTFVDQPGLPLVSADLTLDGKLHLTQKRFSNFGSSEAPMVWAVPVQIKYADKAGTKTQTVLLDQPEMTVALNSDGPPQWVMPNAGSTGYYRWTVPPRMLAKLAESGGGLLDVSERVGLLGDVAALLDAGEVTGDDYLHTLNHFANDSDPRVISTMLTGIAKVHDAFITPDLEDGYAAYVRKTLRPALDRFGLQTKPGEDEEVTRFRPQLIGYLGDDGRDLAVAHYADSLAHAFMKDPGSIDPTMITVSISLAAQHGDRAMFEECKRRFESASNPQERSLFLGALGSFRDSAIVTEALAYSLSGPLRPNEFFYIPFGVSAVPKYADMSFDWMMEHYEQVMAKMPPLFAAFLPYSAGGCSRERLAKAEAFFGDVSRKVAGTEESLAKVSDQVNDCAGLREREGARVAAYLKQFVAADE